MFHVEHMKMHFFFLILVVGALSACTKADPQAYKGDPILQDYQSQLAATNAQLEGALKKVESTKKDLKDSVPQSGQFAAYQKILFEEQAKVARFTQQVQFWKIRIESRAKEAQAEYLAAFKDKKEWPDKGKVEAYFSEKRLRLAKMSWDQKDRIAEYEKANKASAKPGAGSNQGSQGGGH